MRLLRARPGRGAGAGHRAETAGLRGIAAPAAVGDRVPGRREMLPGMRGGLRGARPGRGDRAGAVRAAGPREDGAGGLRELPARCPRRPAGRRPGRR